MQAVVNRGDVAAGKNPGHFNTSRECSLCHSPLAWVPADYRHVGLTYEPQDHRGNFLCTRCHRQNSEVVSWSSPGYAPTCAGCHAQDYKAGESDHRGLSRDLNCAESGCHRISASGW